MVLALQRLGCPKLSCWYFGSTLWGADGTVGNGKPGQKMAEVEIKCNILVRYIYRVWPRRLACKCKNETFWRKAIPLFLKAKKNP